MKKLKPWALVGFFWLVLPVQAGIRYLYEFTGSASDGANPTGLILSGTTLFGMTHGVTNTGSENGTIFKIETNGTGFALLHTFTGSRSDGRWPEGPLTLSGTTLYGMTMYGGDYDMGTIFRIETDGTGFMLLHEFKGGAADGAHPQGDLILLGSTLCGMTMLGGRYDCGTVFSIGKSGRDFVLLHAFSHGDGSYPRGGLVHSGGNLYGMTQGIFGDDTHCGTVFKTGTGGGGFTVLHEFVGGANDGEGPFGNLLLSGPTLFGMTRFGGDHDLGTIFKLNPDGSDFALLHEFSGTPADGEHPFGSLISSCSTLYGMTSMGGLGGWGTIFEMATDGGNFALLHGFASYGDASFPDSTPILSISTLYGAVSAGGAGHYGVIFSLPLSGSDCITLTSPNGGESWTEGSSHEISWTSTGTIRNVNIDYSSNDGGVWNSVVTNTANNGSYVWTVPETPSPTCLVRLGDAANAAMMDASDAAFSIMMSLDLQAERCEDRAFVIRRQYGKISFFGRDPGIPVAEYRVIRRKGIGEFELLRTIAPSELQNNQFQLMDKYLEKGTAYTYRVEAFSETGQLLAVSLEKRI